MGSSQQELTTIGVVAGAASGVLAAIAGIASLVTLLL